MMIYVIPTKIEPTPIETPEKTITLMFNRSQAKFT